MFHVVHTCRGYFFLSERTLKATLEAAMTSLRRCDTKAVPYRQKTRAQGVVVPITREDHENEPKILTSIAQEERTRQRSVSYYYFLRKVMGMEGWHHLLPLYEQSHGEPGSISARL